MNDTVVVTLRAGRYSQDYELPTNVALSELYERLLAVLQREKAFAGWTGLVLEIGDSGMLDRTATLIDYGVCTGSILGVAREEKYDGVR